jgi:hypothetical protein
MKKLQFKTDCASVAAGVPPAVEGGVSPPGIPGSGSVGRSVSKRWRSMNLSMRAVARVATLSRGEREPLLTLGDLPEAPLSELSRIATTKALLKPRKPAAHILLLPPGEGRDEGRSVFSSLSGAWSPHRLILSSSRP